MQNFHKGPETGHFDFGALGSSRLQLVEPRLPKPFWLKHFAPVRSLPLPLPLPAQAMMSPKRSASEESFLAVAAPGIRQHVAGDCDPNWHRHRCFLDQMKAIVDLTDQITYGLADLRTATEQEMLDFDWSNGYRWAFENVVKRGDIWRTKLLAGELQALQTAQPENRTPEQFAKEQAVEELQALMTALELADGDYAWAVEKQTIVQHRVESIDKLTKQITSDLQALRIAREHAASDLFFQFRKENLNFEAAAGGEEQLKEKFEASREEKLQANIEPGDKREQKDTFEAGDDRLWAIEAGNEEELKGQFETGDKEKLKEKSEAGDERELKDTFEGGDEKRPKKQFEASDKEKLKEKFEAGGDEQLKEKFDAGDERERERERAEGNVRGRRREKTEEAVRGWRHGKAEGEVRGRQQERAEGHVRGRRREKTEEAVRGQRQGKAEGEVRSRQR